MEHGFPRTARLLDGKAFGLVFKKNLRLANAHWTLLAYIDGDSEARLGLAIAKKRAKRAVDRNRVKRVARESFRRKRADLPGAHVVVMNRDAAAAASSGELHHSIDQLWNKLQRRIGQGTV